MARSIAERCRQHREEMLLARELHCTPAEARAELTRRAARARWQEAERRLAQRMRCDRAGPSLTAGQMFDYEARRADPQPWMMRD